MVDEKVNKWLYVHVIHHNSFMAKTKFIDKIITYLLYKNQNGPLFNHKPKQNYKMLCKLLLLSCSTIYLIFCPNKLRYTPLL